MMRDSPLFGEFGSRLSKVSEELRSVQGRRPTKADTCFGIYEYTVTPPEACSCGQGTSHARSTREPCFASKQAR